MQFWTKQLSRTTFSSKRVHRVYLFKNSEGGRRGDNIQSKSKLPVGFSLMSLISADIICKTIGPCAPDAFRRVECNECDTLILADAANKNSPIVPQLFARAQGSSRTDTLVYYRPGLILKRRLAFRSFVYSFKVQPRIVFASRT